MKLQIRLWASCATRRHSASPPSLGIRHTHHDSRQRIADFWIPSLDVQKHEAGADATQLLIRAGYLRQAYAGIFQMLPLGLRVQEKLERLIDKHMRSVNASKVALSSLSSQTLWERSGRLKKGGEIFTFKDRKDTGWLLAPTHEEEITTLLASLIYSRQQLPVRLYQIGRKYRDEKRPRGGLLRGREFLMKDLYTFDATPEEAHKTYDDIRRAYRKFLGELKVSYVEARATSGDMGGNLSHEYHFPDTAGEDTVITCSECDYARNEEFVSPQSHHIRSFQSTEDPSQAISVEREDLSGIIHQDFITADGQSLLRVFAAMQKSNSPIGRAINPYVVKAALEGTLDIDTGVEEPLDLFLKRINDEIRDGGPARRSMYYLVDSSIPGGSIPPSFVADFTDGRSDHYLVQPAVGDENTSSSILKQESGDPCPQCKNGTLKIDKAIEIGHTFHLGTRYSSKLSLAIKEDGKKDPVSVEMGCHGIGVSRLIAATAACLSDDVGLNWPRAIAPFEAVIVVQSSKTPRLEAAQQLYDQLSVGTAQNAVDVVLDDRSEQGMGWKLKDADAIGYPVIIVVGKAFDHGKVEVQCRRLNIKQEVDIKDTPEFVRGLLQQL